jgi:GMP synthase-like glutamine amidotransferase
VSRRPRAIVINNDHPASAYGAGRLAAVFEAAFETEVVTQLAGFAPAAEWLGSRRADALVLSGSELSLTSPVRWMLEEEELLRVAVDSSLPVFAICFGHQLLGHAFGAGLVTKEKRVGLFDVTQVGNDPVFAGLGATVSVPEQHSDQLDAVPGGFELIATSDYCPVQAIRHEELPVYGVQFHPCYGDGVFAEDEAWEELGWEGPFVHDGGAILENAMRILADAARGGGRRAV